MGAVKDLTDDVGTSTSSKASTPGVSSESFEEFWDEAECGSRCHHRNAALWGGENAMLVA